MSRVEIVTECEHGMVEPHETSECWAHGKRHKNQPDCYCEGGSRRVVDGPTDEMRAAAMRGWIEEPEEMLKLDGALDAAWAVMLGG